MIAKHILLSTLLNEPKLICLHTVKCFQILLFNTTNSIKHKSFIYTQLKDQTVLFVTIQILLLRTGAVVNQWRCHETSACGQNDLQSYTWF